jgi:uncharacterized RmlC-like cupin family protein
MFNRRMAALLIPLACIAQRPVPVDNDWARVVVATSAPGPKGRMHLHNMNRVMVYLDRGAQRLEFEDGSKKEIPFGPGDVKWDPKGGLHTSENRGGSTFRVVEVELKKPGGIANYTAADPVSVAPDTYKVEFENDQVRVLRVRIRARQKIAFHEHTLHRIVVPLTEVDLRIIPIEGTQSSLKAKPGDAIFIAPAGHREENMLDAVSELILIELKG